jgi:NAD(P)-dependent dehydrogenase (short-subunit alcohol dehydrogenase family)
MPQDETDNREPISAKRAAFVITGPTSGIGRATAFELAKHGTLILVGRDVKKLNDLEDSLERAGHEAVSILCDMSDMVSVRKAAAEIAALKIPLAGLLNNAGIMPSSNAVKSAQGWDLAFATNHLGPFVLTEELIPFLQDRANVVFLVSGVEDPERKPAKMAGFRGGRYISAQASIRGEWVPGGSKKPGMDAYATSKQCALATALELDRENPRLRVSAIEPGFIPSTGLGRDANVVLRWIAKYVLGPIAPIIKYWSTPKRAAKVITKIITDDSGTTGEYYDEIGRPMLASELVRDPQFTSRVIAETRELLERA